jgi:hypothetical protein
VLGHGQQITLRIVEVELDRVHQAAHQEDPEAADLALVERGGDIGDRYFLGVETPAAIAQHDDELVAVHAP